MRVSDKLTSMIIYTITLVVLLIILLYVQPDILLESITQLGIWGLLGLSISLSSLYLIDMIVRTYRWKLLLLAQGVDLKFTELFFPIVSALMINLFTIARAGEAVRMYSLKRNYKTKYSDTLSSIVIEQVLSIIGLLLVVTGTLFFLENSLTSLNDSKIIQQLIILLFIFSFAGLVILAILFTFPSLGNTLIDFFPSFISVRLQSVYNSFQNGLHDLRSKPNLLIIGLISSASIWIIEGIMLFAIAFAVFPAHEGFLNIIDIPWVIAASCAGNITFIIPILPGAMGEYEAVVAIILYGAPNYPGGGAVSVALIDRFTKTIMLGLLGGYASLKLGGMEILRLKKNFSSIGSEDGNNKNNHEIQTQEKG